MSKETNIKQDISIGKGNRFLSLLTLLFIGLKLTGYITWNWFWVLSPILIPLIILVILMFIYAIIVTAEK